MKTVIGLEVHVQLRTESKLFCSCPTKGYRDAPANSLVCPSCLAQPGGKPWGINGRAVEQAIKVALALGCEIVAEKPVFMQRKNYIYADLASGYQRTSKPIGINGTLSGIRIHHVHLEEDPGRYDLRSGEVDFNRSGIPLVEIVTEPDFETAEHARRFLEELSAILEYLQAGREEAGSMRIDANLSIQGHPRSEVKNINSFKGVFTALLFEEARQKNLIKHGMQYDQETRHFEEGTGTTIGMRKKETAEDYRYFPDPDVPPLVISQAQVEKVRKSLPELPSQKRERFEKQYKIDAQEAFAICLEKELADSFEAACKKVDSVAAARFFRGVLKKQLNYRTLSFKNSKLSVATLVDLLQMLEKKEVTEKVAEQLLIKFLDEGIDPRKHAEKEGLTGVQGEKELEKILEKVLGANQSAVADYERGKQEALHFLAGQVMRETRGKASPEAVQALLKKKLG